MENVRIRSYRAISDGITTSKFIKANDAVLQEFEVKSIVKNNDWLNYQNVYIIVLEDENENVLGGCRLHLFSKLEQFPMQSLTKYFNSKIFHFFKEGVAEVCGLFLAKNARSRSNFNMIFKKFISLSISLRVDDIIGMASKHSVKTSLRFGFKRDCGYCMSSPILYPNEKHYSYFVHCNIAEYLMSKQEEKVFMKMEQSTKVIS